jgi:hypothetical protein
MRAALALTFLWLGLGVGAPEPEYRSLLADYLQSPDAKLFSSLVEIESSTGRGDRLPLLGLRPAVLASASADLPLPSLAPDTDEDRAGSISTGDLCHALLASAQENDLPVPFFANLLWQESRLRNDAVSRVGALGIAQFMPDVALETGLQDPFDPFQAIPASARLLRSLRAHFRNLGLAAAAYNAGAHRVSEWLEHRRRLPRETRIYVARVTGRSAEDWRKTPPGDAALTFVQRLPCRALPAFAELERAQAAEQQSDAAQSAPAPEPQQAADVPETKRRHRAARKFARTNGRPATHLAAHERHSGKHQAERSPRGSREKRKSA